ncbi:12153_t:CDS:2 [Funneliformis geosporum]|nr:12153_t:CDS:2 [Funneliformis geosporum]
MNGIIKGSNKKLFVEELKIIYAMPPLRDPFTNFFYQKFINIRKCITSFEQKADGLPYTIKEIFRRDWTFRNERWVRTPMHHLQKFNNGRTTRPLANDILISLKKLKEENQLSL